MILINGVVLNSNKIDDILPTLESRICKTLQKPTLNPQLVIDACHKIAVSLETRDHFDFIEKMIKSGQITEGQLAKIIHLIKRKSLNFKLKTELGEFYRTTEKIISKGGEIIHRKLMPLGVLLHIITENVNVLPVYSVIEGLLAGNINILMLSATDQSFTIQLLNELVRMEPMLSEYIYIFDTSYSDIPSLKVLTRCSNAIVVWGNDEDVLSIRKSTPPNTKIIEWGHKISFAYITIRGMEEDPLRLLAHHVLSTGQLLYSSCQGIYIDSEDGSVIRNFCERFIPILDSVAASYPNPPIEIQADLTLLIYNQELESVTAHKRIFQGKHCSLIACTDKKLTSSFTHGNCWVKALPRNKIISNLHQYKGYLQTTGLLCAEDEREDLCDKLCRAGVTRITNAGEMSSLQGGESHNGEYPLRRYSKIVEY